MIHEKLVRESSRLNVRRALARSVIGAMLGFSICSLTLEPDFLGASCRSAHAAERTKRSVKPSPVKKKVLPKRTSKTPARRAPAPQRAVEEELSPTDYEPLEAPLDDRSPEEPFQGRMRTFREPSRPPPLDTVPLSLDAHSAFSPRLPSMRSRFSGRIAAVTDRDEFVFYTFDPELQDYVEGLVRRSPDNHLAIVAMEPMTGRVLALAGHSISLRDAVFHNGYPAASLFKVVTAAAAVEHASVTPDHLVRFRGGNFTLERHNFRADPRRDNRTMTIGEAMGRSANPVFGRIALEALSPRILSSVAHDFGFNEDLQADVPIPLSQAYIPREDYELARTGAGFGEVTLSPVHAASMVSGIANGGNLLRPIFIDKVLSPTGALVYRSRPSIVSRMISQHAAQTVFEMMENTTSIGTGRRAFTDRGRAVFPNLRIAAKRALSTEPILLD